MVNSENVYLTKVNSVQQNNMQLFINGELPNGNIVNRIFCLDMFNLSLKS